MQYDVLVLGSGGAALSAALSAKSQGISLLVAGENYPTRSQTSMAQGGINAALGNVAPDSITAHIEDTLKASGNLASKTMVEKLCQSAPETINWLDSIGLPFSRTPEGKVAQRQLGGASGKRACYSQDYTGLKILHTLFDQCIKEEIPFLYEHFLLDLCVRNNRIQGALLYDIRTGEIKEIHAKSIILATGGYGGLYFGYTTNTHQSSGDGIAAALRAGATLSNMEFVQFHPTALKGSGVLISESARGAGGKLLNSRHERFVDELQSRDVVSRAIWEEMQKGEEIFLDIRHLGEAYIDKNIPQERKLARTYANVDPVYDLIPIAPVAHYSMGGVSVDTKMMSSIEGLFCAGEVANAHIHGANRLGGNSLLEIVSFGKIAGYESALFAKQTTLPKPTTTPLEHTQQKIQKLLELPHKSNFYDQRSALGELFYTQVGILRDKSGLEDALQRVQKIQEQLPQMGLIDSGRVYNTNLVERIKFENTLLIAQALLQSAMLRQESRGAHFRTDFPHTNESFAKESLCQYIEDKILIEFQEVPL